MDCMTQLPNNTHSFFYLNVRFWFCSYFHKTVCFDTQSISKLEGLHWQLSDISMRMHARHFTPDMKCHKRSLQLKVHDFFVVFARNKKTSTIFWWLFIFVAKKPQWVVEHWIIIPFRFIEHANCTSTFIAVLFAAAQAPSVSEKYHHELVY